MPDRRKKLARCLECDALMALDPRRRRCRNCRSELLWWYHKWPEWKARIFRHLFVKEPDHA